MRCDIEGIKYNTGILIPVALVVNINISMFTLNNFMLSGLIKLFVAEIAAL